MFNDYYFAYYRFTLEAGKGGLVLPPFKGDLLRQVQYETLLRRHCCISGRQECINRCLVRTNCPYAFLFKKVDAGPLSYRNFHPLPPPLAWHPPLEKKTDYASAENIYFQLTLSGRGLAFLEKLVLSIKELGEEGLKAGGSFALTEVQALCPLSGKEQPVYQDEKFCATDLTISGEKLQTWAQGRLPSKSFQLQFLTPTCLQVQGEYLEEPLFPVLVRELFRKASLLYYFFHDYKEMEVNYRDFLKDAEQVQKIRDQTRFTASKTGKGAYGSAAGLLGKAIYSNPNPELLALLKLGEFINLGENSQFGFGRYRLKL